MPSAPELHQALATAVGRERVFTNPADCFVYGYDNSRKHHLPDVVVFALTEAEIQAVVQTCRQFRTALVVRGRGTRPPRAARPTAPRNGGMMKQEGGDHCDQQ
jgi:D-lactate dehydrogenase